MNSRDNIVLHKNWDLEWSAKYVGVELKDESLPIFSGRDKQLNQLSGHLAKNDGGVIFISGENGAGKTSLTYMALNELQSNLNQTVKKQNVKEKNSFTFPMTWFQNRFSNAQPSTCPRVLCVPINTLIFESDDDVNQQVLDTMKQMVRSMVKVKRLEKIQEFKDLTKLKEKITQTKIIRSGKTEEIKEVGVELRVNLKSQVSLRQVAVALSIFGALGLGPSIWYFAGKIVDDLTLHNVQANTVLVFVVIIIILAIVISRILGTVIATLKKSTAASEYFEIKGVSIHELEQDLNTIIKRVEENNNLKVVFVFEELDRFEVSESQTDRLVEVLKALKLLFHDSSASFIFLVGTAIKTKLESTPYTTLPTVSFYLSKTSPNELIDYISHTVGNMQSSKDRETINMLKLNAALLIKRANGNFYSLKQLLRAMRYFKEGVEYLQIEDLDADNSFLGSITLAAFPFIDSQKENIRTDVFLDLMNVVDDCKSALAADSLGNIDLSSFTFERKKVTKAFLEYIYKTIKAINPNVPDAVFTDNHIGNIPWRNLQDALDMSKYSLLYDKQTGVILSEEAALVNKFDDLIKKINKIYGQTNRNLDEALTTLTDRSQLSEDTRLMELINKCRNANAAINGKMFQDRGVGWQFELVQTYLPAVNGLIKDIEMKIRLGGRFIVVRGVGHLIKSKGTICLMLENSLHNPGEEFSSFVRLNEDLPRNFHRKFALILEGESVFNILLGKSEWTADMSKQDFVMIRFDNRQNGINGILEKPLGTRHWRLTDNRLERHVSPPRRKYVTLRKNAKGDLHISFPNGKFKLSDMNVKWIAFANELGEVTVNFRDF